MIFIRFVIRGMTFCHRGMIFCHRGINIMIRWQYITEGAESYTTVVFFSPNKKVDAQLMRTGLRTREFILRGLIIELNHH